MKNSEKTQKSPSKFWLYTLSRYLLGALFLFSGFAKSVNPFGLSIQFGDYFAAMSLDFLTPFAQYFAVLLPVTEMLLGAMLILGLYRQLTAWAVALFMSFFTLLTLWIALYNPVKDCGCFGDLLILSNWETLAKNIFFMLPTIVVLNGRNEKCERKSWRTILIMAVLFALLPVYTYSTLPIIDATPYKIGTNVWQAMHDGTEAEVETTLIYKNKKSGENREFTLEDKEWHDITKWDYVETITKDIKPGIGATIGQLPIIDNQGVDRAEELLSFKGRTLIIVATNPQKEHNTIAKIVSEAKIEGVDRVALLHSSLYKIEITGIEIYSTDQSALRTIIQNQRGGKLLLDNGVITRKEKL